MGATELVPVFVPGRTKAESLVVVMTNGLLPVVTPGIDAASFSIVSIVVLIYIASRLCLSPSRNDARWCKAVKCCTHTAFRQCI